MAAAGAQAAADAGALTGSETHWLMELLLVDSWFGVWLALFGISAQLLFMSRMLVQWIASERARRSVMPVAFWWLSLAGAAMLLVYGVLREDVVIILAQAFGFVVYLRNLWLIHRVRGPAE
jgi:lipid-A-disaccharide synthase-like uncharacterized protein